MATCVPRLGLASEKVMSEVPDVASSAGDVSPVSTPDHSTPMWAAAGCSCGADNKERRSPCSHVHFDGAPTRPSVHRIR
jgi:hypothetical protein